ncbi:zinc finger and BTB domain-containing protein 16 isoform X7 [Grus americana]|uniref:zinc finger and BTB domain-containing protein 16 isoform X7 n=1 Tax=Grus americana TaxID=9117 RepID=UPI002407BCEB|nr:zinc finger and BTB domain-containing protein 16 isoform X7 [Grus americana]
MDLTKMGMIQLQNPCHPTGLLHKANQMRLAGTLCDVVIMVDSQEFHAHRTVLACTSKMFEILFHRNSQHYTLDFLSPKTFQQILEYAYTATLQAKVEDLDDLLYAAEILEIEYLEEQCLKILETIQASEDNDAEVAMADGGAAAEDEEERKSRYIKGLFVSKPTGEESSYAGVAGQSLPAATAEQSPSASASFGPLSAMSPTKAAVDSLMTIGQSLLQGAPPPGAPEDSRPTATRRPPGLAEVKTEAMQVDDTSSRDSPRAAEPGASGGEKPDEKGKEGPGTPTRSSVITSARELHYAREEGAEPPPEPGQGLPPAPEPSAAAQGEKPLGIYSLLPNHKTEPVLGVPPSVASALHVQPALAVSMDFSAYGGLLPQGFIQRELFSKLGELAAGMKTESRALGEQCSVCGAELPDNETLEQHRKLHSGMKTYGCELCGKRFLDSLRLRMHLLAHSAGAKALVCDQCGAQFSKEDALETHRQTHTEENPGSSQRDAWNFSPRAALPKAVRGQRENQDPSSGTGSLLFQGERTAELCEGVRSGAGWLPGHGEGRRTERPLTWSMGRGGAGDGSGTASGALRPGPAGVGEPGAINPPLPHRPQPDRAQRCSHTAGWALPSSPAFSRMVPMPVAQPRASGRDGEQGARPTPR